MAQSRALRTKWVEGYEGRYQIREDGVVLSFLTTRGRLNTPRARKLRVTPKGYLYINLRLPGGRQKHIAVHRLVGKAFVRNPLRLPQINHRDFDRANNNWRNLKWVTPKQNTQYSMQAGRLKLPVSSRGEAHHASVLNAHKVRRIRKMIGQGMTNWRISKLFGVWEGTVRNIRLGISWRWLA